MTRLKEIIGVGLASLSENKPLFTIIFMLLIVAVLLALVLA